MSGKVTLQDIATRVGVSSATVSLILNNRDLHRFSAETIDLVQRAAGELGYSPHKKSFAKRAGGKNVLIFCPSVFNLYYASLVQGVEQAARGAGYHTMVVTTYWDPTVEPYTLAQLKNCPLAGVVYCMPPQNLQQTEAIARSRPTVVIGDRDTQVNLDMAELNNYNAGTLIAHHLLGLGHQHIGYITTTLNAEHPARQRRLRGIQDTFAAECPQGSVTVWERPVTVAEELNQVEIEHQIGTSLTRQALEENPDVTAFVAINDMVAYGVLDALELLGHRVPEDYSVCGFDNLLPSRFRRVQLTTVEHSIVQKGRRAFRLLCKQMENREGQEFGDSVTRVEYPSVLMPGRTTAPPRRPAAGLL